MRGINEAIKEVSAVLLPPKRSGRDIGDERADLKLDRLGVGMNFTTGRADERGFKVKGVQVRVAVETNIEVGIKAPTPVGGGIMDIALGPETGIVATTLLPAVLITETLLLP